MVAMRPRWAERLQSEREARGWNKVEMARHLLRAADFGQGNLRNLARQIRRWEEGAVFPRDWADAYATAFQVDRVELFGPENEGAGASWEYDPNAADDVKRRALLGLLATAAAVPLGYQTEEARTALNAAMGREPTDRDADAWERVAYDYAHEVGLMPASQVVPELLADFTEISVILSTAQDPVRSRVVHVAARLAALTAITLTSLGDPRSARRWWRTAARAADESGDHVIAALIRGRQAVFSLYDERPRLSVLDVADEAIAVGRGEPCAGVVSGYAAKAQALAELGRGAEALTALGDLHDVFERLPDHTRDDRASQWGWGRTRLLHVESHVHSFTGDIDRATRAQDEVLALYTGRGLGRLQVELHRTACMMRAGDVDDAARHAMRVWSGLPPQHIGDGLIRRTALASLSLAPSATVGRPTVREAYKMLALTSGER
ncbi:hypothetical protein DFJ69_2790 [Thermomonospora umbrina]|uniref:HTH cro/C1-type domain-containing protein n=2 Tax=Thermomonospora umbrina TaxID=111806 RepID=A0A3D9STJ2_9ACTN|nr:hypothetical protein DFJ69_2790 [Thermomonospora umbrina]